MVVVGVGNADARYAYARQQGADLFKAPVDQPYGVREYGSRDLDGHLWYFQSPLD
jgi:uncharacterized glyoxalase superfamily protein PhnB